MGSTSAELPPDVAAGATTEEMPMGAEAKVTFQADVPLTDAQTAKLQTLRGRVEGIQKDLHPLDKDYWGSDHALKRVLVARQWNVDAAEKMYKQIVAFRAERQCWKYLNEPGFYREPEVLRRYFPSGFVGTDKEGFPVLVERIGTIDLVGLHASCGTEQFLSWVCFYHEIQERLMRNASEAQQKDRHKMTCIIDMAGISLRHCSSATLSVLHKRTRLEEDHYPEVVKRVFLINTPSVFASVWSIVKRFMDQGTVDKMQILDSNYLPTLLKYMEPEVIPAFLTGGKLTDPLNPSDKECSSMIGPGGIVPLPFLVGVGADGNGAGEEVSIPAGKTSDVLLHVPSHSAVSWSFGTADGKDIGFQVTAWKAAAEPAPIDLSAVPSATIFDGVTPHSSGAASSSSSASPLARNRSASAPASSAASSSRPGTPSTPPASGSSSAPSTPKANNTSSARIPLAVGVSAPSSAAAAAASSAVCSVFGVHIFAPAYAEACRIAGNDGKSVPNPFKTSTIVSCDEAPIVAAPGTSSTEAVPASRITSHTGTVESNDAPMIVRLRWDNSYSWMASKTVARRVDVTCTSSSKSSEQQQQQQAAAVVVLKAEDRDDVLAAARDQHKSSFHELIMSKKQQA